VCGFRVAEPPSILDPRIRWVRREWDFLPLRDPRPGPGGVREP
jgi:hypothetical protein